MDVRTNWASRAAILCLTLMLLLNLTMAMALADGWKANDDANDDPDALHWWFAAKSIKHRMEWWDVDQHGAMDQVLDSKMKWDADVQVWFQNQPDRNLVHEVNTDRDVYEANDWFWTDLPAPDHNEDDNELEEWQQGHEEKEIGWDNPAQQIPGRGKRKVYTGFNSGNDGNAWFESQSELTMPDPLTGLDPWWPEQWDWLGRMDVQGAD